MNLISFTDVDTTNRDALREFIDLNAMVHETIFNTLLGTFQIMIEHYPLWSQKVDDKDWLLVHDKEHKAISDALNLGVPPDLNTVDFNDREQASEWLQNHYLLHQQINLVLGL